MHNDTELLFASIIRKVPMYFETLLFDSFGNILNYSKNLGELLTINRS